MIADIIGELMRATQRDPDLYEVSVWLNGKPPDAREPTKEDLIARAKSCVVIGVRVDPRDEGDGGFIRIDDSAMADIMGRH